MAKPDKAVLKKAVSQYIAGDERENKARADKLAAAKTVYEAVGNQPVVIDGITYIPMKRESKDKETGEVRKVSYLLRRQSEKEALQL